MWLSMSCSVDLTRLWHVLCLLLTSFWMGLSVKNEQSLHELMHSFSLYSNCPTYLVHVTKSIEWIRSVNVVVAGVFDGRAWEILIWWSDNDGSNCWFVSQNFELNTTLGKINENANKRLFIQSNRKSNNGWCKQSQKNLKKFVRCGKAICPCIYVVNF